jgi:hypothetical protein
MREGSLRDFPDSEIKQLRCALAREHWDRALRIYFGSLYDPSFVDWIVYVSNSGPSVHTVLWAGELKPGPPPPLDLIAPSAARRARQGRLRGVSTIWVLIFADTLAHKVSLVAKAASTSKMAADTSASADTATPAAAILQLYRRSVAYQRDPFLTAALKAIASKIGGADVTTPSFSDTAVTIRFAQIARDTTKPFYVAMGRLQIGENSHVEIGVTPLPGFRLDSGQRNIYRNVNNASASWFGFGLATGATFGASTRIVKNDTVATGRNAWFRPNVYLFAQVNLIRPDLPINPNSAGIVVGTNILRDDPLNDLLLTASLRFLKPVELLAGVDFITSDNVRTLPAKTAGATTEQHVSGRAGRPFLGVAFQF